MTDHSIGEADEGSVGLDREKGEDRTKGEHQAAKQKTTTAEEKVDNQFQPEIFTCPVWG